MNEWDCKTSRFGHASITVQNTEDLFRVKYNNVNSNTHPYIDI